MKLQSISAETAEKIWQDRFAGNEPSLSEINVDYLGDDDEVFSDLELEDLRERLETLQAKYDGKNFKSVGGKVDAELPEIIHDEMRDRAGSHELSNLGFWRWLSHVPCDGFFWNFIMWRLSSDKVINWGITSPVNAIEVYFYRAWLRGHKMYDPTATDPYKYARIGSSDVWRSHILRQDFGKDREFVKAFLDTIYDEDGKTIVGTSELRKQLIPELRAWSSSATFAHLSYQENLDLIKLLRSQES